MADHYLTEVCKLTSERQRLTFVDNYHCGDYLQYLVVFEKIKIQGRNPIGQATEAMIRSNWGYTNWKCFGGHWKYQ